MTGKTTRLLMVLGMVMFLAGGAQGASVTDVVSGHLASMDPDPDPPMNQINPIVFEDDDWTVYVDNGAPGPSVGDVIMGVFDLPIIWEGQPVGPAALNVRNVSETNNGTVLGNVVHADSTIGLELTGLFELELKSIVNNVQFFAPVAAGSRTLLPDDTTAGLAMMLYEDPADNFSHQTGSLVGDAATVTDGTPWATLGGPFGSADPQFYTVAPTATVGKLIVEFAMDFLQGPPAPTSPWNQGSLVNAVIKKNNLGTDAYAQGGLNSITDTLGVYDYKSDTDTVVLYAPVPPAVFGGLGLFGLGLLVRRRFF